MSERYTGEIASQYDGEPAVQRGTEDSEWQVPEAPADEVPSPVIEEDDSSTRTGQGSPPFISDSMLKKIAESKSDEPRPQSIEDFDK